MKFHKVFSVVLILALLLSALPVLAVSATASASSLNVSGQPDFGPNVMIFDPSMPLSQIQAKVDAIANQQVILTANEISE